MNLHSQPMKVYAQVIRVIGSQSALAELCGVSRQAASRWKVTGIPPRHCMRIERRTGIPATRLCPEVFGGK